MVLAFGSLPPEAVRIAARMLVLDPDERPTPQELLKDPYFSGLSGSRRALGPITELHELSFSDMKMVRPRMRHCFMLTILPSGSIEYFTFYDETNEPRVECSRSDSGTGRAPTNVV
jgi:serine/threonine protein kinase